MSDQNNERVPRGDHVPGGKEQEHAPRAEPGTDSTANRGHAVHGRGVPGSGEHADEVDVQPGHAEGSPRGSAAWGSEKSGGSVIDKRGPDK